jgi:F0F1-type ATP synthase membrane subunit c/vacuolar-type H+-ATPase subunit K
LQSVPLPVWPCAQCHLSGQACSSAILGVAKKGNIAGKSFIAPGIIESFALFGMIGGIVLAS